MRTPAPDSGKRSKVVLVEDHPMFRERLAQVIGRDPTMEVSGEADNVESGFDLIEATRPDIVITDLTLKGAGGLELLKALRERGLSTPVLVLSMHSEALYADRVIRAGGRGYITKDRDSSEVLQAIRRVLAGEIYLSPEMTAKLMRSSGRSVLRARRSPIEKLTDRELEIFRLFGTGANTREIAQQLSVSENTICTHRQRIKEKLDVKNFTELYSRAARWVRDQEA